MAATTVSVRPIAAPFVVAPPSGTRVRVRLHLNLHEERVLAELGAYLGRLYRREIDLIVASSGTYDRTTRKRALTAMTSARWAGTITRAAIDQYELSMRALADEVRTLRSAVSRVSGRLALPSQDREVYEPGDRGLRGYRTQAERWAKQQRLHVLQTRLRVAEGRLELRRPYIVIGGRSMLRERARIPASGSEIESWRRAWTAGRAFIRADGESGKTCGNLSVRVLADGTFEIRLPTALEHLSNADHGRYRFTQRIDLGVGRLAEWADRIFMDRSIRYDITHDPGKNRWYLDASWKLRAGPQSALDSLRQHPSLAVDLNADHLAAWVVCPDGNPVGPPITIPLVLSDGSATWRDAQLRHAITRLIKTAKSTGCASISIEDLDFADARRTGREALGGGRRGRRLRSVISGIPTRKFRDRVVGMAYTAGLYVIAVDPAYTSRWGAEHWQRPLRMRLPHYSVTRHHAAAVVIGRRAHGKRARRKAIGARTRSAAVTPRKGRTARDCERTARTVAETRRARPAAPAHPLKRMARGRPTTRPGGVTASMPGGSAPGAGPPTPFGTGIRKSRRRAGGVRANKDS